jgi:hypothetical protein
MTEETCRSPRDKARTIARTPGRVAEGPGSEKQEPHGERLSFELLTCCARAHAPGAHAVLTAPLQSVADHATHSMRRHLQQLQTHNFARPAHGPNIQRENQSADLIEFFTQRDMRCNVDLRAKG